MTYYCLLLFHHHYVYPLFRILSGQVLPGTMNAKPLHASEHLRKILRAFSSAEGKSVLKVLAEGTSDLT